MAPQEIIGGIRPGINGEEAVSSEGMKLYYETIDPRPRILLARDYTPPTPGTSVTRNHDHQI